MFKKYSPRNCKNPSSISKIIQNKYDIRPTSFYFSFVFWKVKRKTMIQMKLQNHTLA